MKKKIIDIIKSPKLKNEEKAERIIALAKPKDEPMHSEADELGEKLAAMRDVLKALASCRPAEISIPPKLCLLLAEELANRTQVFYVRETKEIFQLG